MTIRLVTQAQSESDTKRAPELSIDDRFEILKNNRRRIVLEYLQQQDDPVELSALADHVTAIENDTDVDSITSSERKRVYVALYQFHLPKMAGMDIIEYDQDRGLISLTDRGASLYTSHEDREPNDRRWDRVVAVIVAVGVVGIAGGLLTQQWLLATAFLFLQTILLAVKETVQTHLPPLESE